MATWIYNYFPKTDEEAERSTEEEEEEEEGGETPCAQHGAAWRFGRDGNGLYLSIYIHPHLGRGCYKYIDRDPRRA